MKHPPDCICYDCESEREVPLADLQRQYDAAYGIIRTLEKELGESQRGLSQCVCKMALQRRELEAKLAAAEADTKRLRYRLKHIEAAVNYQSEDDKKVDAAKAGVKVHPDGLCGHIGCDCYEGGLIEAASGEKDE